MDIQQKYDIRDTFAKFANHEVTFVECFDAFFETLNMQLSASSLQPIDFRQYYTETTESAPQYFEEICQNIQNTYFLGQITDSTLRQQSLNSNTENLRHRNYEGFVLFGVELKPPTENAHYNRTFLANITRCLNRISFFNPVIAFIRYGNYLTISACERTNYVREIHTANRGEKLGKVSMLRDIHLINPHRGHIDILQKLSFADCKTFNDIYDKWQRVFSTETLTESFYKEVFNWFMWAQNEDLDVYFPSDPKTEDDDRKDLEEKLIRLITRMIFVWFLKQKDNLIPSWIFDTDSLKGILKDFDPMSETNGDYYNAIIQNLFFATLNKPISERTFAEAGVANSQHFGIKTIFRDTTKPETDRIKISKDDFVKRFESVPFLNGGLFECLDKITYEKSGSKNYTETLYDGFSTNTARFQEGKHHYKKRAHVPNVLFFGSQGLITVFNKYYFTVQENTPLEQDISLDPELLGKVFENLLGAYNPETREQVRENSKRKETGSFYTPAEIVNYMVNQSLVQYLANNDDQKQRLLDVLDYKGEGDFSDDEKKELLSKLYDCKVFDPACGSGAFPMGMLNQMVHLLNILDPKNTLWETTVKQKLEDEKNAQINDLQSKTAEEVKQSFGIQNDQERLQKIEQLNANFITKRDEINRNFSSRMFTPDYWRKLYVIQNCLFGSDIQKIAIQITKLRFFISLIVNQNTNDDRDTNYGIIPLPNLETKFVCANTLLTSKMKQYEQRQRGTLGLISDPKLLQMKDKLFDIRQRYFYVKNVKEKKDLKDQDHKLCDEIKQYIVSKQTAPDTTLIDNYKQQIAKSKSELETVREPKYVLKEIQDNGDIFGNGKDVKIERIDINARRRKELKDAIANCEIAINKELNKQNDNDFEPAVNQVTSWDPYDQNASAEFFDADFMFNIQDGFYILIGNPPYIQLQNNGGKLAKMYEGCGYKTLEKTGDIYCLFYERAMQLLKDGGISCLITSNKWMRAGYGESLRKFFVENTDPKMLIDFAGVKVFDSATVDTNILLAQKASNTHSTQCCITKELTKNDLNNLSGFVRQHTTVNAFSCSDSWVILSPIEQSIKQKIEAVGTPLKDWDIQINYGIKTGFNDAFIITTEKKDEILSKCTTEQEREKTAQLIRPILRGRDIKRYGYDWANVWLICTHNGIKGKFPRIDVKDYPAIKAHLDTFGSKVTKRSDQGDTPYNLRNCAYWEDFDRPKIVYPETTVGRSEFCYEENGIFLDKTCFFICGTNLKYLQGILTSKVVEWYLERQCRLLGKRSIQYSKQWIEQLPIPTICNYTSREIITLVDQIVSAPKDNPNVNTKDFLDKIDILVCQLYGLTDDEKRTIGFVEKK